MLRTHTEQDTLSLQVSDYYWLLLRSGIVQSVPCTTAIYWSIEHLNLSSNRSLFIHQTSLLWLQQTHLVVNQEKTDEKWGWILSTKYFFHTSHGYSVCRKGLRHGADGFNYAPEEVMLWIFTAFKDPSSSAGFEPTNLGSNCKYANHYTNEETYLLLPITVKVWFFWELTEVDRHLT
jgi:hypothetical protein